MAWDFRQPHTTVSCIVHIAGLSGKPLRTMRGSDPCGAGASTAIAAIAATIPPSSSLRDLGRAEHAIFRSTYRHRHRNPG